MNGGPTIRTGGFAGHARIAIAALLIAAVLWQVLAVQLLAIALQAGNPRGALAFGDSAAAHAALARTARTSAVVAAEARAGLAAAPIDQQLVTLLAQTTPPAERVRLLQLTAALGWRDPLSQLWLAQSGAAAHEPTMFAQRFDAFARVLNPDALDGLQVLDAYIRDPAIRAAMVIRLSHPSLWRRVYLGNLRDDDPQLVAARMDLLDQLARTGAPASRTDLLNFTGRLEATGLDEEAHAAWQRFARPAAARNGLLTDETLRFAGQQGTTFPWEWTVAPQSGGYVQSDEDDAGEQALHVHSGGGAAGAMLWQQLALAPGRYELRVDARAGSAPLPDTLHWSVACRSGPELIEGAAARRQAANGTTRYAFAVPPGCRSPRLSLVAVPGTDDGTSDLWLRRVAVTRAEAEPARQLLFRVG